MGFAGTILHYDGSTWSSMTSGTLQSLNGVWGSGANDVYVVGAAGAVLHYCSDWTELRSGASSGLNGVGGSGATDVLAVGDSGAILHYDGSTLSSLCCRAHGDRDIYGDRDARSPHRDAH